MTRGQPPKALSVSFCNVNHGFLLLNSSTSLIISTLYFFVCVAVVTHYHKLGALHQHAFIGPQLLEIRSLHLGTLSHSIMSTELCALWRL